MTLNPPVAKKIPFVRSFHGHDFVDNYEWLRDKDAADTRAYLEAENAYVTEATEGLETLRENIYQEIKSRVKETAMSVPQRMGNYWYYTRTEEGKSYGYSCRKPVANGENGWVPPVIEEGVPADGEEVILDLNALADGHEFFSLGASSLSTSGNFLAYSIDVEGDERFTLRVKDLRTGEHLSDEIEGVFYGATWVGEEYLFYQRVDDAWRPDTVWRHRIGTPVEQDVRVFHEPDERFNVGVGGVRSEKFLTITAGSKTTTEIWALPQDDPEGQFRLIHKRKEGLDVDIDHAVVGGQDVWLVTHNATGPNFAVGWTPVNLDEPINIDQLHELVAHRDDVRIEGVDTYRDHITLGYRRGAIGQLAVMKLDGAATSADEGFGQFEELTFDEELYSAGSMGNPEWDAPVIRLSYGSFTTPAQVWDLEIETGKRTLLKEQEVLGGFNRADYTSRRLWVTARDGAQVPVSLVYRTDLDVTAPNPTLLYGYGSYEQSIEPAFSVARLSLLDRGMIFAVAHVRGGGELGRGWYDNGKMEHKRNTFTDFIDVADALLSQGITDREHLVAEGGSAGGLLMGAVANMAGDRFKALLAAVPFVDPLTSMLKPELPLTVGEWEEWGDPLHDASVYDYMASYAPYENIEAKIYPNILATTSLNDTRVLYVEPAKWIAKLRDVATGGEFYLKTEMSAGHGGVSGRYAMWRETAFEWGWLLNQATGLEK